jgi:hypothetical protein
MGYFARNIDYLVEKNISKENYEKAIAAFETYLKHGANTIIHNIGMDKNVDIYHRLLKDISEEYNKYCIEVYKALKRIYEEKEANT